MSRPTPTTLSLYDDEVAREFRAYRDSRGVRTAEALAELLDEAAGAGDS